MEDGVHGDFITNNKLKEAFLTFVINYSRPQNHLLKTHQQTPLGKDIDCTIYI